MARSRNIKPGFFKNEELVEIEPIGRLLYIGLWCLADREGRLEDRPKRIKGELFPYENWDVNKLLNDLVKFNFIVRYEVNGEKYISIPKFLAHQTPHKNETESHIPAPRNIIEKLPEEYQSTHADSLNLIPDSLNLIPDCPVSEPEPLPNMTLEEKEIIKELSGVSGYKVDYQIELDFVRKLIIDYPYLDPVFQIKKWCASKLDTPLKEKSRPHSQIANWFGIAEQWRKEKENGSTTPRHSVPDNRKSQSELDGIDFGKFEFKG